MLEILYWSSYTEQAYVKYLWESDENLIISKQGETFLVGEWYSKLF